MCRIVKIIAVKSDGWLTSLEAKSVPRKNAGQETKRKGVWGETIVNIVVSKVSVLLHCFHFIFLKR